MSLEILNPVRELVIADGAGTVKVRVRELVTLDVLAFFEKLGSVAGGILNAQGQFEMGPEVLRKMILSSSDLAMELLEKSTDLDRAALGALPFKSTLRLLKASLELNLSEEIIDLGKEGADHVRGVIGGSLIQLSPSGGQSTSSFAKDTPSPRSTK